MPDESRRGVRDTTTWSNRGADELQLPASPRGQTRCQRERVPVCYFGATRSQRTTCGAAVQGSRDPSQPARPRLATTAQSRRMTAVACSPLRLRHGGCRSPLTSGAVLGSGGGPHAPATAARRRPQTTASHSPGTGECSPLGFPVGGSGSLWSGAWERSEVGLRTRAGALHGLEGDHRGRRGVGRPLSGTRASGVWGTGSYRSGAGSPPGFPGDDWGSRWTGA